MKKKIVMICLVVALLLLAAGGTLAYFTDTAEKENTFTVGNVEILLEEPGWEETGSEEAENVYPGQALAKDPMVTNEGNNPCFVKVAVEGLECLQPNGMITYRTGDRDGVLGADWVQYENYFYYTKVLEPGESTTPLFEQIVIPTEVTTGDGVKKSVYVKAYAVQAQGAKPSFEDVKLMTVAEIAAWFTTCGL